MDQVDFQDSNSQSRPKSPLKLVHSDINNVEKAETPTESLNEIIMSPSKPFEKDNGENFNEKHFSTTINNRNGKISPDEMVKNPNENSFRRGIDSEDNGEIQWEIETVKDHSNSIEKRKSDESSIEIVKGKYDIKKEILETQHRDYGLAEPKPNSNIDFSGQSSENPSPILSGSNFSDYNLKSGNPNLDDQYMSNRFFIDDTNESDHIKYSDNNINLFELTPDQQLAIRELELRKPQSDFEEDYDYSMNYDNIPDYDVKEKLESLNAQLANEPSPPEPEHRNSRVAFKEELVSLVAPVQEYPLSESEQEEYNDTPEYLRYHETRNENVIEIESPVSLSRENYENAQPNLEKKDNENSNAAFESYNYERNDNKSEQDPEPISQPNIQSDFLMKSQPEKTYETKFIEKNELNLETNLHSENEINLENKKTVKELEANSNKEKHNDYNSDQEIDIVVSRGGKFQLMDQSDMVDSSGNIVNPDEEILEPTNKQQSRPISAPATKGNRNEIWSSMHTGSPNNSVRSEMNYQSKTTTRPNSNVPKVDRELLQRQKEKEEKRKKEQQERDEIELKNKREMNEKCFNAWLQNKNKVLKEETERKKKEDEEERKQQEKTREENKAQEIETLKELARNKELQRRREEKLRQYRIQEMEQTMVIHTATERNKAFREWVKKKRQSNQMKQKEEKQKARITRLAMRQCRKSQNLAQAIHQANSFRYLDFLGYP